MVDALGSWAKQLKGKETRQAAWAHRPASTKELLPAGGAGRSLLCVLHVSEAHSWQEGIVTSIAQTHTLRRDEKPKVTQSESGDLNPASAHRAAPWLAWPRRLSRPAWEGEKWAP